MLRTRAIDTVLYGCVPPWDYSTLLRMRRKRRHDDLYYYPPAYTFGWSMI